MFNSTAKILKAAEVLEKVAMMLEQEELSEKQEQAETLRRDFIEPIRRGSSDDLPKNLEEKLASTDPEVLSFFKQRLTESTDGGYSSLGGPSTKVAHDREDADSILAFVTSED
jgi:hypothetical protein